VIAHVNACGGGDMFRVVSSSYNTQRVRGRAELCCQSTQLEQRQYEVVCHKAMGKGRINAEAKLGPDDTIVIGGPRWRLSSKTGDRLSASP
jgi:hypothetical protein